MVFAGHCWLWAWGVGDQRESCIVAGDNVLVLADNVPVDMVAIDGAAVDGKIPLS